MSESKLLGTSMSPFHRLRGLGSPQQSWFRTKMSGTANGEKIPLLGGVRGGFILSF